MALLLVKVWRCRLSLPGIIVLSQQRRSDQCFCINNVKQQIIISDVKDDEYTEKTHKRIVAQLYSSHQSILVSFSFVLDDTVLAYCFDPGSVSATEL